MVDLVGKVKAGRQGLVLDKIDDDRFPFQASWSSRTTTERNPIPTSKDMLVGTLNLEGALVTSRSLLITSIRLAKDSRGSEFLSRRS